MSGIPSSPRAKEYSELFDFFESLLRRRPRAQDTDATPETVEVETPPVPPELVPLFHRKVSGSKRAVHTSAAGADSDVDSDSDDGCNDGSSSSAAFPMPRNVSPYPFSFKMMIHKIYEDEFLSKCNEFLAKSRAQFKPLAEQPTPERSPRAQVPILGGGKHNLPPTRPRRHSLATGRGTLPTSPRSPLPPRSPMPSRAPMPPPARFPMPSLRTILDSSHDDVRAAKKRCTGRRLSALDPVPGWVYHSEVAAAARDSRESFEAAKDGAAGRYKGLGLGHPSTINVSTPSKKRVRTRAVSMAGPTARGLMV
ncbi:hypothetical protein HDZ31DRAFT_84356 [Schizophyllum fasciatum]